MQNLHNDRSGIACAILAGGRNNRMGQHKAFLDYRGRTFIEIIRDSMSVWFDEVFVVTNNKLLFSKFPEQVFEDIIPDKGPLAAIHTALTVSTRERVFCVACDMPDCGSLAIEEVIRASKEGSFDCFVPRGSRGPEPLFAIYTRSVRGLIEEEITRGQLSVLRFLERCRTRYIDITGYEKEIVNINTPQEYRRHARKV
ncbi:MAG: molybdenum cofactor guanylyltransferase [Candidatus Omnitrophica bacterium]|nr:molybdenum cofactor guanylyltransferase [Candidatus Omnitrophota bacterium]